jgi:NitT/TauT family transport system permease protein
MTALKRVSPAAWVAIVLVTAWQLGAWAGLLNPLFYGSPLEVVGAAVEQVQSPPFWSDVWLSVGQEMLTGYALAVVLAIPLGILTGWSNFVSALVEPWLNALNATPRIALLPLLILWFGLGLENKIAVVFVGVFVSVMFNTFYGVRTVDSSLLNVGRTFGASRGRLLRTVVLPTAVPFALVGMRLGVGRAVVGVLVAEYFTSNAGLGNFIMRAGQADRTGRLLFGAIVITSIALIGFYLLGRVERRFTRWRPLVGSA